MEDQVKEIEVEVTETAEDVAEVAEAGDANLTAQLQELNNMEVKAPELTFAEVENQELKDLVQTTNNVPAPIPAEEEARLSPEEMQQVEDFVKQIDITNSQAIMNYGVGTQQKIADFSQKALDNVRAKDLGETGDMITKLVVQLKNIDIDEENKGFLSFFRKKKNDLTALKSKYSRIESNVDSIKNELEKRQITLMKDTALLDKMYEMNLNYFKELTMYILAGQKKLVEVRTTELPALQQKAAETGLPEDAQAAKDLAQMCERFEKKLYDLELTRTVAIQTSPQIRMVQASDTMMAEKIQSTIVNTIPLWKNQMVIAMGVEHAAQAAKAQQEVTEMTNELLKHNAEKLHQATVDTARESERGIVDVETLQHTNEELIKTLDEVLAIQQEGREKRAAAEIELTNIENQLKAKLLEAAQSQRQ
jgi:uncharacterized protein YaaN involved in tellurite resistance